MEILPYTVHEREDTGLFNAKLGIWLFLASEVMLFGSLFSSYVLLRIGAAHWPRGVEILNIPLGATNTAVLIISSVTMVLSWAALKENNVRRSRLMLGATILCALAFMLIKSYEYGQKFGGGHVPTDGILFIRVFSGWIHGYMASFGAVGIVAKIFIGVFSLGILAAALFYIKRQPKIFASALVLAIVMISLFQYGAKTSSHFYPPMHNTYMAIYFTLTGLHAFHVLGGVVVLTYFLVPGAKMWQTQPERFTNRLEIVGLYWHFVDLVWIFLFPVLYLL